MSTPNKPPNSTIQPQLRVPSRKMTLYLKPSHRMCDKLQYRRWVENDLRHFFSIWALRKIGSLFLDPLFFSLLDGGRVTSTPAFKNMELSSSLSNNPSEIPGNWNDCILFCCILIDINYLYFHRRNWNLRR